MIINKEITQEEKQSNILKIVKNEIVERLKETHEVISLNKRGALIYAVIKDKQTKEVEGRQITYSCNNLNLLKISIREEDYMFTRKFNIKEMLYMTENPKVKHYRTMLTMYLSQKIIRDQFDIINGYERQVIKPGYIIQFDKKIEFINGYKGDKFKFVKNNNFVLPDEPIFSKNCFVIKDFRRRFNFQIIQTEE